MDPDNVPLYAALVISGVAVLAMVQKLFADMRAGDWDRIQWAIDLTLTNDPVKQDLGHQRLQTLYRSRWIGARDKKAMLDAVQASRLRIMNELRRADAADEVTPSDSVAAQVLRGTAEQGEASTGQAADGA